MPNVSENTSNENDVAILTCALTGVLTHPQMHPVPVTPKEMAQSALGAYNNWSP